MHVSRLLVRWTAAAALVVSALSLSAGARAGDDPAPAAPAAPPPQKTVKHPFFDGLVGSYTTTMKGQMGDGSGKVTVRLGVGGTAVIEDYDATMGKDPFSGHGVFKVGDDGKTVTIWWFDTMMPEAMKLSGALTDTGYDVSGDIPGAGMKMRLTFEKKGATYEMRGFGGDGAEWMKETWTRVTAK